MLNGSGVRNGAEGGISHIEDIIQNLKEIHSTTYVEEWKSALEEAIGQLQDFKDGRLFGRLVKELEEEGKKIEED